MNIDSSQTLAVRTLKTDVVKSTSTSAVAPAATGTVAAKVADGFEVSKGGPAAGVNKLWWPPISNVGLKDRNTAGNLHATLTKPYNDFIMQSGFVPGVALHRDPSGMVRGPNGQPLIKTKLDDGKIAYVDPNTNQYYLANKPSPWGSMFGSTVKARGPLPLPAGAQFSNRYYSDKDVRQLNRDAKSHFHFTPFPVPVPVPGPIYYVK